jgi:NAD dependent epimerase/dehydratase family enzyme
MKKPMWLPPVPKFMMKLMFGEMADILINGVDVSNEKLKSTGFKLEHLEIQEAINALR